MDTLVSIIIPVYNKRHYLRKCLDSVLTQTLRDIEVIIMDDESCDDSFEIAEKYAALDSRCRVFRNVKNLGLYKTRYEGITQCAGRYIAFVDADDWLNPDVLRQMYVSLETLDTDMVQARMCRRMKGISVRYKECFDKNLAGRKIDGDDFRSLASYIGMDSFIQAPCWAKLYKADILRQIDPIEFSQFWGEDQIFNIQYLREIRSMAFVDYVGYNYRWGGATTATYKFSAIKDYKHVYLVKRMLGQNQQYIEEELVMLLYYYVRSLMTELGFTRQAVEMTLEEELRDPVWQRLIPGVSAADLVEHEVQHVQRNPLKYMLKRLLN